MLPCPRCSIPLKTPPTIRNRPYITWTVAALCVLVTLGAMLPGVLDEAVKQHGFLPSDPMRNNGGTVLTSFFLHGGILHRWRCMPSAPATLISSDDPVAQKTFFSTLFLVGMVVLPIILRSRKQCYKSIS